MEPFSVLVICFSLFRLSFAVERTVGELGIVLGSSEMTLEDRGTKREFHSFRGVPYGRQERFKPAKAYGKFAEGMFDGRNPQLPCFQESIKLVKGPFTEDCLTLNIYAPPVLPNTPLPVIVFIHGGSFRRWTASLFDGKRLLNRDVILVSINYRLNVFSFFCLEDDTAPGNLALYDQILALEWIRDYVSYFGGDPNRITISGQSAGSAAVTYLLGSPMAKGLFHAAIASSGDAVAGWTQEPAPLYNSLTLAASVGCHSFNRRIDKTATLNCMKRLQPESLLKNLRVFHTALSVQTFPLHDHPVVYPQSALNSLLVGDNRNQIPIMLGSNKEDGSFRVSGVYNLIPPSSFDNFHNTSYFENEWRLGDINIATFLNRIYGQEKKEMVPALTDLYTLSYFRAPAYATARAHSITAPTYLYSYEHFGETTFYEHLGGIPAVPKGVAHGDDIVYLFNFGELVEEADKSMSTLMLDLWTNFAKNKVPTSSLLPITWPEFTVQSTNYLRISSTPSIGNQYLNETDYFPKLV